MTTELYSARGGSRETPSNPKWPLFGMEVSATWPLAKLILTDDEIQYKVLLGNRSHAYSEVKHVKISRLGYVVFTFKGDKGAYGFTGMRLNKIIEILQLKGVEISGNEMAKLNFAMNVVRAQIIFAILFITIWLTGLCFFLSVAVFHIGVN